MRILNDSLAHKILVHLLRTGGIPRKNLYTAFQQKVTYNHFAQVVKRLVDEGYLDIYREKELNHIKLSKKGEKELTKKDGANEENNGSWVKQACVKPRNKQEKKRVELVAGILGLCEGAGIKTSSDEKPPLCNLFEQKDERIIQQVKQALIDGVYYSTKEIRQEYLAYGGVGKEFANWSRLIGIVIVQNKISFLYSTNDKLIRWISSCEKRTVDAISSFLLQSATIQQNVEIPQKPNCVIAGKGYSMIPKLVYGRKWGRINKEDSTEKYKAKIAQESINAHNLSKVYSSAYYAPIEREGKDLFKVAIQLSSKTKNNLYTQWFSGMSKVNRVTGERYAQGIIPNGDRIVYMPYIDLIELEYYKKQNIPIHFVIPSKTQDAVSRVMGPNILSASSIKNKPLRFQKYDKYGVPLIKTSFQKNAGKREPEATAP